MHTCTCTGTCINNVYDILVHVHWGVGGGSKQELYNIMKALKCKTPVPLSCTYMYM